MDQKLWARMLSSISTEIISITWTINAEHDDEFYYEHKDYWLCIKSKNLKNVFFVLIVVFIIELSFWEKNYWNIVRGTWF